MWSRQWVKFVQQIYRGKCRNGRTRRRNWRASPLRSTTDDWQCLPSLVPCQRSRLIEDWLAKSVGGWKLENCEVTNSVGRAFNCRSWSIIGAQSEAPCLFSTYQGWIATGMTDPLRNVSANEPWCHGSNWISKYMIFEKLPIHFQYSTSVRCRCQYHIHLRNLRRSWGLPF